MNAFLKNTQSLYKGLKEGLHAFIKFLKIPYYVSKDSTLSLLNKIYLILMYSITCYSYSTNYYFYSDINNIGCIEAIKKSIYDFKYVYFILLLNLGLQIFLNEKNIGFVTLENFTIKSEEEYEKIKKNEERKKAYIEKHIKAGTYFYNTILKFSSKKTKCNNSYYINLFRRKIKYSMMSSLDYIVDSIDFSNINVENIFYIYNKEKECYVSYFDELFSTNNKMKNKVDKHLKIMNQRLKFVKENIPISEDVVKYVLAEYL
jgi:hypothetical protein